ncbi:hypothetical protein ACFQY7_48185 [Actinomadura luteofluorescens]|uniref:hypothetical protein n=1 Tax=Actinomadura luteofluorescens TaxID=46163 RepID=UPI003632D137
MIHQGVRPEAVTATEVRSSAARPEVRRRRRAMTVARLTGRRGAGASSSRSGSSSSPSSSAAGSSGRLCRRREIPVVSVSRRSHMGTRTTAQTATIAR